jgi:hypothetical protein
LQAGLQAGRAYLELMVLLELVDQALFPKSAPP